MATQQPLTRFSGDPDDPIQPATFLQDFEVRMTELMTPRADLASRIKPYLERDSRAWEWYTEDLTATDRTGAWEAFEAKFHVRFPSQKKEKKSAKSYLTSLEGERITHEIIMKMSEDTNQPYHQWWANRLLCLAKGAEVEKTKQSIGTVWKHLPYALKKVIDEEYDNWEEFTSAIKAVKWSVLKVEVEHGAGKTAQLVVPETPRTKLTNSFAAARISTPPSPSPIRARPTYTGNAGSRKPRRIFTALDEGRKVVLRRGIAAKVQHPNTPNGVAAWKAELLEWTSALGSVFNAEVADMGLRFRAPGQALYHQWSQIGERTVRENWEEEQQGVGKWGGVNVLSGEQLTQGTTSVMNNVQSVLGESDILDVYSVHNSDSHISLKDFEGKQAEVEAMVAAMDIAVYEKLRTTIGGWEPTKRKFHVVNGSVVPGAVRWKGRINVDGAEVDGDFKVFDSGDTPKFWLDVYAVNCDIFTYRFVSRGL
ncbi:hypothetical protein F5877DRAFT_76982 [Lentinula edodes]|nr:hypothetical protein F5877DRAFT_76982 [Lentinula edodes]